MLEEEGEEVLSIIRGPDLDPDEQGGGIWAVLGREEVSIWSIRVSPVPLDAPRRLRELELTQLPQTQPKVVLAKLRRTPISLRTQGSNASLSFDSPSRLVITTNSGHHLLYSLTPPNPPNARKPNIVYALPGGEKGRMAWPPGPGEGRPMEGLVLRALGERGMPVGDGVGWCVSNWALCIQCGVRRGS